MLHIFFIQRMLFHTAVFTLRIFLNVSINLFLLLIMCPYPYAQHIEYNLNPLTTYNK